MKRQSAARAEIEERIEAEIARKRARGEPMEPLRTEGLSRRGAVTGTFWGTAWCERMETCGDYRDRLPAGKSRLRAGAVYDLTISPREVFAYVAGEELHEVLVKISPLSDEAREALQSDCAGRIGSVLDLLSGRLGEDVLASLIHPDRGLIPRPGEIRFQCDCPDHADVCLHGAAVLYAIGARLDRDPALLFVLREVDREALVSGVVGELGDPTTPDGGDFGESELSALFGIAWDESDDESV